MAYPDYIDYHFAISRGETAHTFTNLNAYCAVMSNTAGFILAPKNLYAMTTPAIATASADYMRISSSSAGDATAGTGLVECNIEGIDEDGAYQTETVLISGQTPKTTASKYIAINRMWANTCGSGGVNAGDIYATIEGDSTTSGVPKTTSTTYNFMATGDNRSSMARYIVPLSQTAYIHNVNFGQNESTNNTTFLAWTKASGAPKQLLGRITGGVRPAFDFKIPIRLEPLTYVWLEAYAGAGVSVTAADVVWEMALIKEDT